MMSKPELPFNENQTWKQKEISADSIWAQVQRILDNAGKNLPTTPRRPDVRVIVRNISGREINFLNPGDYTGGKQEKIPAGEAAMIMPQGISLGDQRAHAKALAEEYDLGRKGLSQEFVDAIGSGKANQFLKEAYGPTQFDGQVSKLSPVTWDNSDTVIDPVIEENCAYGARNPEKEMVFETSFVVYVAGTNTSAEKTSDANICIAVSKHWETGEISTRPINTEMAKWFYGLGLNRMPNVSVDIEGNVLSVDLKDGTPLLKPAVMGSLPAHDKFKKDF